MALGTLGSTLNDELNRLANGGTYRDKSAMVDEALAAKQWANRENIIPYSTDTVGILNEIAGLGLDKRNWLDFNGVCNYIAGTTGLPAAAALRQVYNTTDLLTSQASYYVDAIQPTNWGSLGYVRLNGVSGNFLSTPDATELDITGDIDIRLRVSADDWTPTARNSLLSKMLGSGSNNSYALDLETSGALRLVWSANGSALITATSTASVSFADGSIGWVRATLDVDNGASGNTATFFTSTDGTTWTQLGSTVVTAGVTSIFNSTERLVIGARSDGSSNISTGNLYRAQVLNGIGGTTVLDVNIATDWPSSRLDNFTATTGQTVTVNGVGTVANLGAAGSLLPTTVGSSTAADSNDPKFLDWDGTNYVYLPGVAANYLSVPDAAALDITGDLDLRVKVAMDDWTPSATICLIGKWQTSSTASYRLTVGTTGLLTISWTTDGSTGLVASSTVAPTISDGSPLWVRVTLDVDNGASGRDIKFFTSTDGTTWSQLGTTVTQAGTTSIYSGTSQIEIGSRTAGTVELLAGKIYRAQIFNGIDGTKVLDVDTSVITAGSATSFAAVTGQTVTINRSTSGRKTVAVTQPTWLFGTDDYMEVNNRYMASGTYLYLPGTGTNHASAPDAAALDITGDIDLRAKVSLDDWTPSGSNALVAKYGTAGQRSYMFQVASPSGVLQLNWSADGTNVITKNSTVAPTIADGATLWVRATLDVNNGASGNDVTFYTSTDGTTWTQLGATVTTAGTTSIFSGTSILEVGTWAGGNSIARGKFFRAQVLNGIDGTVAFDANFETSITSLNQTSFTESSVNAATVTINRSGSTYRSAGITTAGYLYPGATNTFSASATDFLNFGASDSFTVFAAVRDWHWSSSPYVSKTASFATAADRGYIIYSVTTPGITFFVKDGAVAQFDSTDIGSFGSLTSFFGIRNVSTDLLSAYVNSTATAPTTDTTTATLSNIETLKLGRVGASYTATELYAAAVFRSALTTAQIRQIVNYFANREVYL